MKGCSQQKAGKRTNLGVNQQGGAVCRMRRETALIAKGALKSRETKNNFPPYNVIC